MSRLSRSFQNGWSDMGRACASRPWRNHWLYSTGQSSRCQKVCLQGFFDKIELLEGNPKLGNVPGELKNTPYRRLLINPVYIYYRVENEKILIVFVSHRTKLWSLTAVRGLDDSSFWAGMNFILSHSFPLRKKLISPSFIPNFRVSGYRLCRWQFGCFSVYSSLFFKFYLTSPVLWND